MDIMDINLKELKILTHLRLIEINEVNSKNYLYIDFYPNISMIYKIDLSIINNLYLIKKTEKNNYLLITFDENKEILYPTQVIHLKTNNFEDRITNFILIKKNNQEEKILILNKKHMLVEIYKENSWIGDVPITQEIMEIIKNDKNELFKFFKTLLNFYNSTEEK